MFYASSDQQKIKQYVNEKENKEKIDVEVIAPAGCGKTTTILYLIEDFTQKHKTLYLVFNVDMNIEMKQRINFTNSPFDINKDNLEQFTFHGYMRKILQSKITDIGFDYTSGEITNKHMGLILERYSIREELDSLATLVESFNDYSKGFIKETTSLDCFIEDKHKISIKEDAFKLLKRVLVQQGYDSFYLDRVNDSEKEELARVAYNEFLSDIFEKNTLNEIMPHDVYYKYVYHHYSDINLFADYEYVLIDESQDIDKIIFALLERCNTNIIKVGDNFQKINGFRGTVSALGTNKNNKVFYLKDSYRLTPYVGLLSEAFLKREGQKLGFKEEEIPTIFGYSKDEVSIENTLRTNVRKEDFFDEIISDFKNTDIRNNDLFQDAKKHKEEIESSILKGKKGAFKSSVNDFLKNKDYANFYKELCKNTALVNEDDVGFEKRISDLEEKNDIDLIKELNKIARDYTYKLTKKEMREILVSENGTYGYITRNNKKAIDSVYKLVKKIPHEQLAEIPLFNVKFALSLADTFKSFTKHHFRNIKSKDKAILIGQLDSIESSLVENCSVWDSYLKLGSLDTPPIVLDKFLKDINSCFDFVDIPFIQLQGNKEKLSFRDFGVNGNDIKDIVTNAIKQVKSKTKKETSAITSNELIEIGNLKSINKLMPFDKIVRSQIDLKDIEGNKMNLLENYYKYSETVEMVKENPNVELVKDGAFYNIYCSTTHKVKGLELDNTLIANDLYEVGEDKPQEDLEAEFNLSYVALTRSKKTIRLEEDSPLEEVLNSIIKDDYKRYFSSNDKDIVLSESLSSDNGLPSHEVFYKDKESKKVSSQKIYYTEKGSFANIKDLSLIIDNSNDNIVSIVNNPFGGKPLVAEENQRIVNFKKNSRQIDEVEFNKALIEMRVDVESMDIDYSDVSNAPF